MKIPFLIVLPLDLIYLLECIYTRIYKDDQKCFVFRVKRGICEPTVLPFKVYPNTFVRGSSFVRKNLTHVLQRNRLKVNYGLEMGCFKKKVNRRTSSEHGDRGEGRPGVQSVFVSISVCWTETFEYSDSLI